jgi:phage terminase large subunit
VIEIEIDKDVYLPCYRHILEDNDIDIELIWGSRDSGKSRFAGQLTIEETLAKEYSRVLLIKETHESIKDSQWQTIKDIVESKEYEGVDTLFKFITSPLGITCVNRNRYLARGLDNPGKIKSISNPSLAWIEEGNQISEQSFITLLTGLRSDFGRVKLIITFNPEATTPAYEDFWLFKMFFKNYYPRQLNFTSEIVLKVLINGKEESVILKYRSTHTTYHDNPYISTQRIAFHESLKATNYYFYQVYTLGLWGNVLNDSPYCYAFSRQKHVSNGTSIPHPKINRSLPLILSWDFNRNPMTCTIAQHDEAKQKMNILEVIRLPKAGVDGMCEYILVHYPGCLYLVTGDYNGDNESSLFQEQVTHYLLIKNFLNLSDTQIKIKPNPKQAKNSTHVNTVLSYYNVIIHGENAKALIFDCENVKRRADGTILKTDRDKPEQQADALDTMRYLFNEFLDGYQPNTEMIIAKANETHIDIAEDILSIDKQIEYTPGSNVGWDAVCAVSLGNHAVCTKFEYQDVRNALLEAAGKWIDSKDSVRGRLALMEVKRLDDLFK